MICKVTPMGESDGGIGPSDSTGFYGRRGL